MPKSPVVSNVADLLRAAVAAGFTPGAVAAWGVEDRPPRVHATGSAKLRPKVVPATPDTWYDLASLTKPLVVTTLCMVLQRRGDLRLGTTVGEVLGERALDRPLAGATIEQLLAHTSGLPAWWPLYASARSRDEALETIVDIGLEAGSGDRVLYSCLDFILLGIMLELIAGDRLDRIFERLVLEPLGLEQRLGFLPRRASLAVAGGAGRVAVEERMTADHGFDPETVPGAAPDLPDDGNSRLLAGVAGNAGLFGTAVGVWRLTAEYLGGGRLLDPEDVRAATSVVASGGEDVRGLGWQLATSPGCSAGTVLAQEAFGHTGFTGTSVWADPSRRAVFVLLCNRHHPDHRGVNLHPLRRRYHSLAIAELGTG
jgi:CubicO group peptidase (beta-lactamase class C family)